MCVIAFVTSKQLAAAVIAEVCSTRRRATSASFQVGAENQADCLDFKLVQIVKKHGAGTVEPDREGRIPVSQCTHIISNTIDFEEYTEAQAMMIPVVTTAWLKTSIQRGKQAQIRPYSPDPRMIFSNVNMTCADIPATDKETIIGATMALGGMESKDLTRVTTHICALSIDHPKCQQALENGFKCKIVLPHW
jgi:hypothetical protein